MEEVDYRQYKVTKKYYRQYLVTRVENTQKLLSVFDDDFCDVQKTLDLFSTLYGLIEKLYILDNEE